jgi:colanic acid/amylovoran biosynthesis protein
MNYCIINAYGRSNRGDSVLLDECISEIRKRDSNAKISCALFYGVEEAVCVYPDIDWSLRIGNSRMSGLLGRFETIFYMLIAFLCGYKIFSFLLGVLPIEQRKTFNSIKKSDVVVSAPGGYIHDTNFAYYIALFHVYLGVFFKKKVILAPQSYGPISSKLGRYFAGFVMNKCLAVCSREYYSHEFLEKDLKLRKEILYRCGDSAFFNTNEGTELPDICDEYEKILKGSRSILGITVVGWSFPHRKDPARDYENYVKSLAIVVDRLVEKYDVVPVVFNQVDGDLDTARKLKSMCQSVVYVDEKSREPECLRPLIACSKIFIGTRFHSCIFAMMEGVPTTAISYLPKTEFIMKDLGFERKFVDICDINIGKIIEIVGWDIENIDAAKEKLNENLVQYRIKFKTLSDVLKITDGIEV